MGGMHHATVETSFEGIIGAGLGSSGSFSVALVGALLRNAGKTPYRDLVAETAWDIEVNDLGWYGGKQDQYAAAFGGLNFITFGARVKVIPAERKHGDALLKWLLLVYIGGERESRKIQQPFKHLTEEKIAQLDQIKELALKGAQALVDLDMELLGQFIDESFELKRKVNPKVSNKKIDSIYEYAKENGAIGGKIIGAGEAGYMIFLISPTKRKQLVEKLAKKGIEEVDFCIDWTGLETRIL
jgi:D-glycero-alpha-D-manno-heptose-7-phosphate kinase